MYIAARNSVKANSNHTSKHLQHHKLWNLPEATPTAESSALIPRPRNKILALPPLPFLSSASNIAPITSQSNPLTMSQVESPGNLPMLSPRSSRGPTSQKVRCAENEVPDAEELPETLRPRKRRRKYISKAWYVFSPGLSWCLSFWCLCFWSGPVVQCVCRCCVVTVAEERG